jgi:hypothetical protein
MEAYPKAGMERTMKVQAVMPQAMARKITVVAGGICWPEMRGLEQLEPVMVRDYVISEPLS